MQSQMNFFNAIIAKKEFNQNQGYSVIIVTFIYIHIYMCVCVCVCTLLFNLNHKFYSYRCKVQAELKDTSGELMATIFGYQAEKLFSISAQNLINNIGKVSNNKPSFFANYTNLCIFIDK